MVLLLREKKQSKRMITINAYLVPGSGKHFTYVVPRMPTSILRGLCKGHVSIPWLFIIYA